MPKCDVELNAWDGTHHENLCEAVIAVRPDHDPDVELQLCQAHYDEMYGGQGTVEERRL